MSDFSQSGHHQSCDHVADVALETGMNNVIERMHGSFWERETVIRSIRSIDTPVFEENRICYNFVRPHEGLDGLTPAEAAGIGVNEENKWLGLIERSLKRRD
jgi:putative transposase